MKKIVIIIFIVLLGFISNKTVKAQQHHTNFQELNLTEGKLIDDYSESDLKKHYKVVEKAKFSGWKTLVINNRVEATFISETIFTYYNDGYTSFDYSYKSEDSSNNKFSFSSVGSITINTGKSGTGFKKGLDGNLKLSYSQDKTETKKETYEFKMKVDPGTRVSLYYEGTGRLTNGVGARYLFWIRTEKGGFEVFETSSRNAVLEKIRI